MESMEQKLEHERNRRRDRKARNTNHQVCVKQAITSMPSLSLSPSLSPSPSLALSLSLSERLSLQHTLSDTKIIANAGGSHLT